MLRPSVFLFAYRQVLGVLRSDFEMPLFPATKPSSRVEAMMIDEWVHRFKLNTGAAGKSASLFVGSERLRLWQKGRIVARSFSLVDGGR